MGCDIHTTLALRNEETGKYSPVVLSANVGGVVRTFDVPGYFRDYEIFGLLCDGVRGGGWSGINLESKGRFKLENLSDDAQDALKSYSSLVTRDENGFPIYDRADVKTTVAIKLHDYYESNDCHSHTFVNAESLELLITRLEKKALELKVERLDTQADTTLDAEGKAESLETIDELIESAKDDREFFVRLLPSITNVVDEVSTDYVEGSPRFDDWVLLICFDN